MTEAQIAQKWILDIFFINEDCILFHIVMTMNKTQRYVKHHQKRNIIYAHKLITLTEAQIAQKWILDIFFINDEDCISFYIVMTMNKNSDNIKQTILLIIDSNPRMLCSVLRP